MPTSLPSAKALMTHADDLRHIVYASWVVPKFFPYMRGLLNGLTKQPKQEIFARSLMDRLFAQPSNIDCDCLKLTENLRNEFKLYGVTGMSIENNKAWIDVSVAMIYFILVTDFQFAAPMSDQMKTDHLDQIRQLEFEGANRPNFPARLLQ